MTVTPNSQLQSAIREGDLTLVRSIIIGQINSDRRSPQPTTKTLATEAETELNRSGLQLFEEDDGEGEFPPETKWSRDTWTSMKVELSNNFSRAKLDFILKMMQELRESGDPDFQPKKVNREQTARDVEDKPRSRRSEQAGHKRHVREEVRELGTLDKARRKVRRFFHWDKR